MSKATIHIEAAKLLKHCLETLSWNAVSEPFKDLAKTARCLVRLAAIAGIVICAMACGGAGAGAPCSSNGDCDDSYQCLNQICSPRCDRNSDCGDGYLCKSGGLCELVISELGDPCASEWDCGLGQSCILDGEDTDGNGQLASTCQEQGQGGNVGSTCTADGDCRNSLCTLGQCSQVCAALEDCPEGNFCDSIPRVLASNDYAYFNGCLPDTATLTTKFTMESPAQRIRVPVPNSAKSFAIVASVNDSSHLVGVTRVIAPGGQRLFEEPESFEDFLTNPIRYSRSREVSTLTFPNDGLREIERGIYEIDIETSLPPFDGVGTAVPEVSVHYKLKESRVLDLTFYFADFEDHPCQDNMTGETLTALSAEDSNAFQEEYLKEIADIFGRANIIIGPQVTYKDVNPKRPDLDGITNEQDLRSLFRTAENTQGIAIFLVRSLPFDGVQTLGTTIPGPPRTPGSSSSGIAVSMDALCYRSWNSLARVTAHSIAGQMGLWNNRDAAGIADPISDSDRSTNNLMYFGEFGDTELSAGQSRVLGLYPGLR